MSLPDGYQTDAGFDPAEDHIGPFAWRRDHSGSSYAFVAAEKHCNAHGAVHGGVLMTFADYAACMAATDHYNGESCVTVSFSSEFVSGARIGALITTTANVTRKTRSLGFVTGEISSEGEAVMTFSVVVKRMQEQS